MNKLWLVLITTILIIGIGAYAGSLTSACQTTGKTRNIDMTVGSWFFDPSELNINCGDHVILNIHNEDAYDHGIGLDLFGLNKRLAALKTTTIEFDATAKGTFTYYCTVPCGDWQALGRLGKTSANSAETEKIGHFDQKGKITIT